MIGAPKAFPQKKAVRAEHYGIVTGTVKTVPHHFQDTPKIVR
jgi:hypothetical protein